MLGYEGWLAGYQMAFDTAKSKLAQNNFALGFRAGDFQLHTNVWVHVLSNGRQQGEDLGPGYLLIDKSPPQQPVNQDEGAQPQLHPKYGHF